MKSTCIKILVCGCLNFKYSKAFLYFTQLKVFEYCLQQNHLYGYKNVTIVCYVMSVVELFYSVYESELK